MKEFTPVVGFVDCTDNPIPTIYKAYRRCYSSDEGTPEATEDSAMVAYIQKMLKPEHAHTSPLEHVSMTFHITCSRAASHQLVRHRIASYSQQSQRYVEMKNLPYIMPVSFIRSVAKRIVFKSTIWACQAGYRMLSLLGAKSEDARSVLPQASVTHVVMTMNCRELVSFLNDRMCYRAQEEIRSIASQILVYAKMCVPGVFENAGPHCYKYHHCPEPVPCGRSPWKQMN